MVPQEIDLFVGDDAALTFTMATVGSIAGDTFKFIVSNPADALVLSVSTGAGITTTYDGSATTYGIVVVTIANLLEIAAGDYKWELRRTNAGREKVLAHGPLLLDASLRDDA